MRQGRIITAAFIAALAAISAWSPRAAATPQQLSCVLTNVGDQSSAQNRPITVIFDDNAKTLQAQEGGQNYRFENVSISNVAISGGVGAVSLGIDRSSLGMVWQRYQSDRVITDFGQCRPDAGPDATH